LLVWDYLNRNLHIENQEPIGFSWRLPSSSCGMHRDPAGLDRPINTLCHDQRKMPLACVPAEIQ
jgi:hypothetical protein